MASPKLPNYLLSHRKRLALSQDEVAFLLGTGTGTKVCRDERFNRIPSLETALAYLAIFKQPAHELFGGLYQDMERQVMQRAKVLVDKIERQASGHPRTRKLKSLADIIAAPSN